MLSGKPIYQLLCVVMCLLSFGCSREDEEKTSRLRKMANDYTNSGVAGWVWQGVGNGVENETQIWQLTFPQAAPNWSAPARYYPPLFADQVNWDIKTTGDFSGDGSADFLWRHKTTGAWKVWQMRRGLRRAHNMLPDFDLAHAWTVVGAGDTDNDGDDDVILNNTSTGEVMVWEMQNHALAATHTLGTKADYLINRVGDFNKDGDVDLMMRSIAADKLIIWEVQANMLVQERKLPDPGPKWNLVCTVDFENDGDDDILVLNTKTRQDKWLLLENYERVGQIIGATNVGYKLLGCGDYDGDGDADTLWQNEADDSIRVILLHDQARRKRIIHTNPFGAVHPGNAGYGFEYRANRN